MIKKKIFHIIPSLISGGAERQLTNIVCNTSDEFNHLVCAFSDSDFFAPEIRRAGHQVRELGLTGKHPWLSGVKRLLPVVREYQPDLIKTWLYDANILGRLVQLRNKKIPLVTTLHSLDYEPKTMQAGDWSPFKVEGLRQIDKQTARLTNTNFVAVSNYVKKSAQKRLGIADSQIEVIYNGVDPESLRCADGEAERLRREFEIPAEAFVYVTVGRVDILKNHALLLRVFPQVLENVPHAYLVIVGTGILEQELKDLANSLGIRHRVRFLGRRKDIGACLEMGDAFVFPTLLEGYGLALVEAMFKKLPCVASDLEVLREVIVDKESGMLFDLNNANELVHVMIELFRKPELARQLGEEARRVAEKRFHIRTTILEWESYYRRVIGKRAQK